MIEVSLSKNGLLIPLVSVLLIVAGLAYVVYLRVLFPTLVPGYGGGERFTLGGHNDYTLQMPWHAHTRLLVALQANDSVELRIDGDYVCNCTRYEFYVEAGGQSVQYTVADRETLLDAQKHPERYADLVVRVGGYSALFTELTRELQDSVIARAVEPAI